MKKHPCNLSGAKTCEHAGAKRFNYGFFNGTANYCRWAKMFICDMKECPKMKTITREHKESHG